MHWFASSSLLSSGYRWILAGSAATAAAQWGIIVLLARFSTPEVLGAYALGLSMAGVAFALGSLELRTLQVTDQTANTPFNAYFRLRLATSLSALAVVSALALPKVSFTACAIVIVSIGRAFEALSDILYARFQVIGCVERIGIGQMLRAALSIALLSAALTLALTPLAAIAAVALANIFVFFLYDVPGLRSQGVSFGVRGIARSGQTAQLIRSGLPFAFVAMMVAAVASMPRFAVAGVAGDSAVGIVAALSYLAVAPNLLITALGQAGMRSLACSFAAGDRRESLAGAARLLALSAAVGCIALGAVLIAGRHILQTIYGVRYAGFEAEFTIFAGAGAIGYLNAGLGYCLTSARITVPQIPMMAVVCAVTFAACALMAGRWGIAGAAAGQAAGLLVQLCWSAVLFTQKYHAPLNRRTELSTL